LEQIIALSLTEVISHTEHQTADWI